MQAKTLLGPGFLTVVLLAAGCADQGQAELLASAKSYLQKNEPRAAEIQLKNLLQQEPASAEARLLLGKALLDGGDAAGAEIELRRAQEFDMPAAAVAPLLAKSLLAQGQHDKLIRQFADVELADADAAVELQLSLAAAYAMQRSPDKARDAIVKALVRSPKSLPALIALARTKAAAGEVDQALAALDEVLASQADSVEAWQLKGDILANGKLNPALAIEAYKQALQLRPARADLHAALMSLYFAQADTAAAATQFEAMKAAASEHSLTKFYEAQLIFSRGDYKLAQHKLQALLRSLPDNVGVLHLAGATELQLGSLTQAESHLNQAVQLQPGFVAARRLLARVYLRADQPAKALAALRPELERGTADADLLTLAGQAALLSGDAKSADAFFVRAAAKSPNDAKARTALAMAQLSKGKADAAFSELQSIATSDKGVGADMALISARMSRGELDAALKAIDTLDKKQPGSALASELRGRVHLLRKDWPSARRSFEKSLGHDPRYFAALSRLAALDYLENKPDAARARFDKLLELDPKNVQALLALAELKRRTGGSADEVAKLIRDAVNANPADPEPRLVLIDHQLAYAGDKAALAAAQAAAAALPGSLVVQEKLARMLMATGDINSASSLFGKIAAQHSELSLGHQGLAETHLAKMDYANAAKSANRALELEPRSMAAQRVSILASMALNRPRDALVVAAAMQQQRPNEALGFILQGEIEMQQERADAAAAAFRKALATRNPAQAPGLLHSALLKGKTPAEAARFADGWLRDHPKDTLFLLYLANASAAQGDIALAEKRYRQLLQLQPDDPVVLNNLAGLLVQQNKPGAVAMAERALKIAPGRLPLMDTLASALAADKQYTKAIELQKQVVGLAPQAPVYRLSLAKIYFGAGEKALARTELDELLKSGKSFVGRDEATLLAKSLASS